MRSISSSLFLKGYTLSFSLYPKTCIDIFEFKDSNLFISFNSTGYLIFPISKVLTLLCKSLSILFWFSFFGFNALKTHHKKHFSSLLAPLAVGQRAYVMARCPSCVRPSVRASVRPCVNFFFKHLLR